MQQLGGGKKTARDFCWFLLFFYFPMKVAGGHGLSSWGKSPAPTSLMTALMAVEVVTCISNMIVEDLDVELTCFE